MYSLLFNFVTGHATYQPVELVNEEKANGLV